MVAKLFFPPYTGFKPKLIRMVVDSLKLPKLF
jgi:aldehyde dehydrogenase (NAD+)